jgi:hypothetical protein
MTTGGGVATVRGGVGGVIFKEVGSGDSPAASEPRPEPEGKLLVFVFIFERQSSLQVYVINSIPVNLKVSPQNPQF